MEAYQLQTERTKEYLELEVSKAYMQLQLVYKAVKVLEKANNLLWYYSGIIFS